MKNKIPTLIAVILSLCVGALSMSLFTGCETIREVQEEHPVAFDVISSAAKTVLQMQVYKLTDDVVYQGLLTNTIDAAFAIATTPQGIAAELEAGVAEIYPDDPELQQLIVSEFATALETEPTVPASNASAPGAAQFQRDLAAALRPDLSYQFDPAYTVTVAIREL